MAFIGTFSRALLESATAVYFGGASVSILDAQGNVILGDDLPDAPTVTSTIADRTYAVGDAAVTVDLRTKFSGATSYTVSPTNAAVTIDGYTLTINPSAAMTSTSFTVRGINGGGSSEPLVFTLTVTAPVPVLLQPFPDQSLLIGGGTVTLPLAEYFSGATGYAVSPANNGATISNGNLVISRTTARDVIITVTATNATGQDTSDSFALLIAAPANQAPVASAIPQQNPTANTAFTVDLSSYFVDPEGAALSFDYTGTLPTGITRNGAVFSGTATVTDQTASGVLRARDPGNLEAEAPVTWAVSAQPAITATIDLQPAGQQSSITFNVAIDGSPTIAQGSTSITATRVGTTNQWTFTAPVEGPISFAATKVGYTAFSDATRTVAPAPAVLTKTANNTAEIRNVPDSGPAFNVQIVAPTPEAFLGQATIDIAAYSRGPVVHQAPLIEADGPGEVGVTLTRKHRGVHSTAGSDVALEFSWPDQSNGDTYVTRASDAGTIVKLAGAGTDENGTRTFESNGIAIAAIETGLAQGLTTLGTFDGGIAETSSTTHSTTINIGPADPDKTVYIFLMGVGTSVQSGAAKLVANGVDYVGSRVADQTDSSNGFAIALHKFACPVGGNVDLFVTRAHGFDRPRGYIALTKGMVEYGSASNAVNFTAGTETSYSSGSTVAGDTLLTANASLAINAAGTFSNVNPLTEIYDAPMRNAQLFVAKGVVGGSSGLRLYLTPNTSGVSRWITLKLRNA